MDDNKSKALAAALAQIEKQFGKGSIMKMGESQVQNDLSVVSTGSLGLDIALGVGGLPRGRVVEVQPNANVGEIVVAIVDNEFTVKYLAKERNEFVLKPANKAYPVIRPRGRLEIFGVMAGLARRTR